jgi:hypothetical protein
MTHFHYPDMRELTPRSFKRALEPPTQINEEDKAALHAAVIQLVNHIFPHGSPTPTTNTSTAPTLAPTNAPQQPVLTPLQQVQIIWQGMALPDRRVGWEELGSSLNLCLDWSTSPHECVSAVIACMGKNLGLGSNRMVASMALDARDSGYALHPLFRGYIYIERIIRVYEQVICIMSEKGSSILSMSSP